MLHDGSLHITIRVDNLRPWTQSITRFMKGLNMVSKSDLIIMIKLMDRSMQTFSFGFIPP